MLARRSIESAAQAVPSPCGQSAAQPPSMIMASPIIEQDA
jgi:hypothetical protein